MPPSVLNSSLKTGSSSTRVTSAVTGAFSWDVCVSTVSYFWVIIETEMTSHWLPYSYSGYQDCQIPTQSLSIIRLRSDSRISGCILTLTSPFCPPYNTFLSTIRHFSTHHTTHFYPPYDTFRPIVRHFSAQRNPFNGPVSVLNFETLNSLGQSEAYMRQ